ncbi:MAG: FHA domain-containing protein [Isosphaeraceae bacterium]
MSSPGKDMGVMMPVGGGDPVPLRKPELVVGRRPSCDIVLDFENVSGKHCVLRYHNQVWHIRDSGSTNGTTVNGARISSEHSVMPDDEIGIAGHLYHIDYEPGAPATILNKDHVIEDEMLETRKKTSLMELAGLDTDDVRTGPKKRRPTKAPEVIERLSADEAEFDDALPSNFKAPAKPRQEEGPTDEDFFKLIEEDVTAPDENTKKPEA